VALRIGLVLWSNPVTGVMHHADAGYHEATATGGREHHLDLPGILG
jgi:urocanate hydratase